MLDQRVESVGVIGEYPGLVLIAVTGLAEPFAAIARRREQGRVLDIQCLTDLHREAGLDALLCAVEARHHALLAIDHERVGHRVAMRVGLLHLVVAVDVNR